MTLRDRPDVQPRAPVARAGSPIVLHQGGFALVYVLAAIFLMGVLSAGMALAFRSNGQASGQQALAAQLVAQANLVRQKISQCAVEFPAGDNGTGFHPSYPATPVSGLVSDLACPGAPVGANNLWTGTDGTFLPRPPTGFTAWTYVNDATSVRIQIQTNNPVGWSAAMSQALTRFSPSEATRVTTSLTHDTLQITVVQ